MLKPFFLQHHIKTSISHTFFFLKSTLICVFVIACVSVTNCTEKNKTKHTHTKFNTTKTLAIWGLSWGMCCKKH